MVVVMVVMMVMMVMMIIGRLVIRVVMMMVVVVRVVVPILRQSHVWVPLGFHLGACGVRSSHQPSAERWH